MLQAWLRGKLSRDQENAEDLLTSSIFGLLSYISPREGLLPVIAQSRDTNDSRPLAWISNSAGGIEVDVKFWPYWQELGCLSCEPDIVIRLQFTDRNDLIVLIEAKFRSSKSSIANDTIEQPNDQLAREWDNLRHVAAREKAEPYLVYLTTDIGVPPRRNRVVDS